MVQLNRYGWFVFDSGDPIVGIEILVAEKITPKTYAINVFEAASVALEPGLWTG